jgi:hypothetical protein
VILLDATVSILHSKSRYYEVHWSHIRLAASFPPFGEADLPKAFKDDEQAQRIPAVAPPSAGAVPRENGEFTQMGDEMGDEMEGMSRRTYQPLYSGKRVYLGDSAESRWCLV